MRLRRPVTVGTALLAAITLSASSRGGTITFSDATKASGVRFPFKTDLRRGRMIATMGGGVAAADFDRDGFLDLFFTGSVANANKPQSGPCGALYRNRGDGTFEDVTARSGIRACGWQMGAYWVDLDSDGRPDLVVAGVDCNRVWHNEGGGLFRDVTRELGIDVGRQFTIGVTAGDVDGDGRVDLYFLGYLETTPEKERSFPQFQIRMPRTMRARRESSSDRPPAAASRTPRPFRRPTMREGRGRARFSSTTTETAGPTSSSPTTACRTASTAIAARADSRTSRRRRVPAPGAPSRAPGWGSRSAIPSVPAGRTSTSRIFRARRIPTTAIRGNDLRRRDRSDGERQAVVALRPVGTGFPISTTMAVPTSTPSRATWCRICSRRSPASSITGNLSDMFQGDHAYRNRSHSGATPARNSRTRRRPRATWADAALRPRLRHRGFRRRRAPRPRRGRDLRGRADLPEHDRSGRALDRDPSRGRSRSPDGARHEGQGRRRRQDAAPGVHPAAFVRVGLLGSPPFRPGLGHPGPDDRGSPAGGDEGALVASRRRGRPALSAERRRAHRIAGLPSRSDLIRASRNLTPSAPSPASARGFGAAGPGGEGGSSGPAGSHFSVVPAKAGTQRNLDGRPLRVLRTLGIAVLVAAAVLALAWRILFGGEDSRRGA